MNNKFGKNRHKKKRSSIFFRKMRKKKGTFGGKIPFLNPFSHCFNKIKLFHRKLIHMDIYFLEEWKIRLTYKFTCLFSFTMYQIPNTTISKKKMYALHVRLLNVWVSRRLSCIRVHRKQFMYKICRLVPVIFFWILKLILYMTNVLTLTKKNWKFFKKCIFEENKAGELVTKCQKKSKSLAGSNFYQNVWPDVWKFGRINISCLFDSNFF